MLRFNPALRLTILLLSLPLSGCGIRPSVVDPPPGAAKLTFPRAYPDPATVNPAPSNPGH
jgi:hypothetical protein